MFSKLQYNFPLDFTFKCFADCTFSKAVESLLHDMLIMDHVSHSLVKYIIEPLCKIKSHSSSLVPVLAEIVSEIREPITTVETGPSNDERRQNDIKVRNFTISGKKNTTVSTHIICRFKKKQLYNEYS